MQRAKKLEDYIFLDNHYLLSLDGTGYFSSHKIQCKHCLKKKHRNGKISYYHQMLGGALVHPEKKQVVPFFPEMITNEDGYGKNDCERNASKRFLAKFRTDHPHLKVIVIEDGLASNAPHIQELEQHNMKYILGAKQSDHKYLFEYIEAHNEYYEFTDSNNVTHKFKWQNDVPLNKGNQDVRVNFLEYWEEKIDKNGNKKIQHFSWVTNILLTEDNLYQIMIGGRSRWKIENETFNTLKNQGYNFEHNYGHGHNHLSNLFAILINLVFLVDQMLEILCKTY